MLISWLLNLGYLAMLTVLSPWVLFRIVVQKKDRAGWREKLWGAVARRESDRPPVRRGSPRPVGSFDRRSPPVQGDLRSAPVPWSGDHDTTPNLAPTRPCVWLHAVSVGEVLQLQPVLDGLAAKWPGCEFVISTTTGTGHDVARKQYPQHRVIFAPLDFSWAVNRALRRIAPTALVLVELELWPNLILNAARQGIPVLLINGRIGERSFRGYRRIRSLMRRLLGRLSLCAVQNETYAQRLRDLGADAAKIIVTGSIKFDRIETRRDNPRTTELRTAFDLQPGDVVFIAGSTQPPEERFALDAYLALRPKHPRLRLILVPRHRERFDDVARLVEETYRLPLARRSRRPEVESQRPGAGDERSDPLRSSCHDPQSTPVCLLDTLGELAACWGLADIAFVGGSLTNRGGQNMIEPAGYGAAVLFGPNTWNFRDVVETLSAGDAVRVVKSADDLTAIVSRLLEHADEIAALGRRAQRLVLDQQGATRRTVDLIVDTLSPADRDHRRAA